MLARIANGRTDLVLDWLANGGDPVASVNEASLAQWCAYYGDVTALKTLAAVGVDAASLGFNLGLNDAAFHGHWQLVGYLIEQGADANALLADTGEAPLHAALCSRESKQHELVVEVLLKAGADPVARCKAGAQTAAFMRDCRTQGETPLHRAAAYGTRKTIDLLLSAGADRAVQDAQGDTPLSWASRALRQSEVLRLLCFPPHSIHPNREPLADALLGNPSL